MDPEYLALGKAAELRVAAYLRHFGWTVETADEVCDEYSPSGAPLTRLRPEDPAPRCISCGRRFKPEEPYHRFCSNACRSLGRSSQICTPTVATPDLLVRKGDKVRWVEVKRPGGWSQVDIRWEQLVGYRCLAKAQPDVPIHLYFVIVGEPRIHYTKLDNLKGQRRYLCDDEGIPYESWLKVDRTCLTSLVTEAEDQHKAS
jgi:hypothetical protein